MCAHARLPKKEKRLLALPQLDAQLGVSRKRECERRQSGDTLPLELGTAHDEFIPIPKPRSLMLQGIARVYVLHPVVRLQLKPQRAHSAMADEKLDHRQ